MACAKGETSHKVLLWDIDGTLISPTESSVDKHALAVSRVLEMELHLDLRTAGKTDHEIVVDLLDAAGVCVEKNLMARILLELDVLTAREFAGRQLHPLPGTKGALKAAEAAGWTNGLLTGNTPQRARTKLLAADLWGRMKGDRAFYGDSHLNRFSLAEEAAQLANSDPDLRIILVGDTPLDIEAGHAANLPVVAVATGKFRLHELEALRPELAVPNLLAGREQFMRFLEKSRS